MDMHTTICIVYYNIHVQAHCSTYIHFSSMVTIQGFIHVQGKNMSPTPENLGSNNIIKVCWYVHSNSLTAPYIRNYEQPLIA